MRKEIGIGELKINIAALQQPLNFKDRKLIEGWKRNSALHMATKEGNNVCIDIILESLSNTENNASIMYKDILVELLEQ